MPNTTAPSAPRAAARRGPFGAPAPAPRRVAPYAIAALVALAPTLPSTAEAIDLGEVYERARDYDATIQAAEFDLESARQQLPLARSAFKPQLTVGGDLAYGYLDAEGGSAVPGEGDDDKTYTSSGLSLSASQTLFNRANAALIDQADLSVRQAEAQFLATVQTLILRVASAYFDVLRAEADVEFSQSELQAIGRQREQAERRFDVGLVPITDVRSAQAQYDLAVAQEIAASNQLSTAQEALRVIAGVEGEMLSPLADDLPLASPDPADIDAWVSLALEQNLDLVSARLASEIAAEQIAIERGARWPTLDLVGTASTADSDQVGRADTNSAELTLQLRLPLYTGGRIGAQVNQARAQAGSAAEQLVANERTTAQQTRDGYRGVQASISRVRALRQALVSTRQSADAIEAGFRAGTRTSIDVLQALRDVFRARSDYAGARYDYIVNTLNLKAAAGTLEESDIEQVDRFLVPPDNDDEAGGEANGEDAR